MNVEENTNQNNNGNLINEPPKNQKKKGNIIKFVPYLFVLAIIVVVAMLIFPKFFFGSEKEDPATNNSSKPTEPTKPVEPEKKKETYKIFNTNSNKRPYAVSINNTPVAVKVQEGLNKAYIVYEIPTEGYTSRLLALFKDVDDLTIGTLRSCRHNFLDYAHESDAILVCFGWSVHAHDYLNKGDTDFLNGNEGKWASAFWRSNPEGLAREHTAYTSLAKLNDYTTKNKYRLTSDDIQLFRYSTEEIKLQFVDGNKDANTVSIPYGSVTTTFKYDPNTKMYTRIVNGKVSKDHSTKEPFTTKNIIIVKMSHGYMKGNYYWDLHNTGTGKGYYITNGKYVPITWKKESSYAKTKYYYSGGGEIMLNDGRTYVELHDSSKSVSIK